MNPFTHSLGKPHSGRALRGGAEGRCHLWALGGEGEGRDRADCTSPASSNLAEVVRGQRWDKVPRDGVEGYVEAPRISTRPDPEGSGLDLCLQLQRRCVGGSPRPQSLLPPSPVPGVAAGAPRERPERVRDPASLGLRSKWVEAWCADPLGNFLCLQKALGSWSGAARGCACTLTHSGRYTYMNAKALSRLPSPRPDQPSVLGDSPSPAAPALCTPPASFPSPAPQTVISGSN